MATDETKTKLDGGASALSAMLGFFGIEKQTLDIGFEYGFGVWNMRVWRRVAHVLIVVAANISTAGAVLIDKPSAVKTAPSPQGNVMTKLSDGGLNSGVAGDKHLVDVLRPSRQQGKKLTINGGAKGGASNGTANLVAVTPLNVTADTSNKNDAKNSIGIGEQFTHGLWIGLVVALWIIFSGTEVQSHLMKPNVKLRGAPLLARPSRTLGWAPSIATLAFLPI